MLQRIGAWVERNERHLGAVLFVLGFITDLLTFTLLDISLVNLAFAGYLLLALLCTLGSHWLYAREMPVLPFWRKAGRIVLPLGAQYAIGSLLSGCLIFYTKSSVFAVSWPFLALLLLVFFGNEVFRKYKDRLTFQTVLVFFSLYAYLIFALPLLLHTLGPLIFLASTVLSVTFFLGFLYLLSRIGRERLQESVRPILVSSAGVLIVIIISYFTGIVPPIPLTMPEAGIYHSLRHGEDGYIVEAEATAPWYAFWHTPTVHTTSGETLYAYSSVFAPIRFSAGVVHHWERYDATTHKWVSVARIAFGISGGRSGGYRGYSQLENLRPGSWRVSVETQEGQIIGRIPFTIVATSELPALHEETH